ncbi:MAG: PEP/pyruvate-binding domain-containing protein [Candidatus Njordarchaeia archaeon]
MTLNYIYYPEQFLSILPSNVGSKAYYVAYLKHIGCKVPKSFFLGVKAYELFVEQNNLKKYIEERLSNVNFDDLKELEAATNDIKKKFLEGEIPEEIRREIELTLNNFEAERLAIRSSATSEDLPFASFAGMYDTYLNVPRENVLEYIKRVWASAWNTRAVKYRKEIGLEDVSMGVIIQEFIPADKSAVLFSADTVTMRPDMIVINSTFGLGEGIVSGEENVDVFYVDKLNKAVKNRVIAEKKEIVVPVETGGTEKKSLENKANEPSLTEEEIEKLVETTLYIEKMFRKPFDAEIIFKDGEMMCVQIRPITTYVDTYGYYKIEYKKFDDMETIWTNINIGELMPGIVLPLSWSIMKKNIDYGFREPFTYLPYLKEPVNFTRLFAGRAYLNYDALRYIPSVLPGGSVEIMDELYLGGLPFEKEPEKRPSKITLAKYLLNMMKDMSVKKKESDRLMAKIDKQYREHITLNLKEKSFEEIVGVYRNFDKIFEEMHAFAIHIGNSAYALPNINMVKETLLDMGVNLDERPLDKELLIGLSEMESELASASMWNLAKMVKEDSALLALFKAWDGEELYKRIYDNKSRFEKFINAFENFLIEYGHRCVGEFKLENKRWMEEPEHVLNIIKHYVLNNVDSPYEKIEKQKEIREKAEQEFIALVKEKYKNPVTRKMKLMTLDNAKTFVRLRENMKTALVKLSAIRRKYILEIADRLVEKDFLKERDDVFYLTNSELLDLIDGKLIPQIANKAIAIRKKVYNTYPNMIIPDIIIGFLKPEEVKKETTEEKIEGIVEIKGIPGSPGVYRGKAKVINNPKEINRLNKGDVLVAATTDLGWTPLYLVSGALVVEIGSVLSHGAIIAREYGIPAVMNAKNATKIIKDGDEVEVDGDNGVVRVLKRAD